MVVFEEALEVGYESGSEGVMVEDRGVVSPAGELSF